MNTLVKVKAMLFDLFIDATKQYHLFLEQPKAIEPVHQFRVKIRTLRALLSFLSFHIDNKDFRQAQDHFKIIHQRFSHLRDIDVLLSEWKEIKEDNPLFNQRETLSIVLNKKRAQELENVLPYAIHELSKNLDTAWVKLDKALMTVDEDEKFSKLNEIRFKDWNKQVKKRLKKLDVDDYSQIHQLRIQFKKVRYLQGLVEGFQDGATFKLKELKEIQDILGAIVDSYIAIDLLQELLTTMSENDLKIEVDYFTGYQLSKREKYKERLERNHHD